MYLLFFFFKQKTAYEMRISDWSSDVCSSDLIAADAHVSILLFDRAIDPDLTHPAVVRDQHDRCIRQSIYGYAAGSGNATRPGRSEEHTSELQSLMRISYAVFCLKKKKNKSIQN